ncbi:MAG: hypothetical protein II934_10170 [Prevotella sp.]|nr:hypothetical protein [Prevotella sp.]
MPQRVVTNLSWNLSWPSENVRNISADYTYVPDAKDFADKADLAWVNQKISTLDSSLTSKVTIVEKKTEQSIRELKEYVIKSLSSKDRIEDEKRELSQLYNVLFSSIKKECQKIENQICSEIRAYQDVDMSLNDRLSMLIEQKNDFVNAKNNARTTLQELKQQIMLADETKKNIGNPNVFIHKFTKKLKNISSITSFLLANVILADIYLLYLWLSN